MNIRQSIRTLAVIATLTALLAPAMPAEAGTCAGLSGSKASTCRQYCNKLHCQDGSTDSRCANLRSRFIRLTGACQLPCDCGNGSKSSCEQCDDGNLSDGDACTNQCTANVCGDGSLLVGVEDCDDGNGVNDDACKNDCTVNTCGDGVVRSGVEQCDDGNLSNGDDCKNDCTDNTCGDGEVRTGVEDCDDGNESNSDACKNDCTDNVCGDGAIRTGLEACDDGNESDNDGCKNNCTENYCGDGVHWYNVEECDDANDDSRDACKSDCTNNVCGDGEIYTGVEICDNGGQPLNQACTPNCELPTVESPIFDDLSYCDTATTDRFLFSVLQAQVVDISVDTVDAETAADLCVWVECEDATEYSSNNDVDCTFPAPNGTSCPVLSYVAPAETNCRLDVGVCQGGCTDEVTGKYVLNLLLSGQHAQITFSRDDD